MSRFHLSVVCLPLVLGCAPQLDNSVPVRPGIEVLLSDSLHLVADRSVGILTNSTGIDRSGVGDIERLLAFGIDLRAVFAPEHGFFAQLDQENIGDDVDSTTGLPIYSLYGDVREPTPEMLANLDVLLIDLQDIGARPYTYISTAINATRAAANVGVDVLLLDRVNPIGGQMQGPVLVDSLRTFHGMLDLPLRHGLTIGEMLRYANDALQLGANLTVVPVDGWSKRMWFDDTGLPWVRPSPNMPNLESATHYPGLVAFEATNLSVGRGTPIAFQVIGAPYLDAAAVARRLDSLPGLAARDTVFTPVAPGDGKYDGIRVPGVRLTVLNRDSYDPVRMGVELLDALLSVDGFILREISFDTRFGDPEIRRTVASGATARALEVMDSSVRRFRERIEPYLIYR